MSDIILPAESAATIPAPAQARAPVRLWPGLLIVGAFWAALGIANLVAPATMTQFMIMFWGPILALVGVVAWWLFFSRGTLASRFLSLLVFAGAWVATFFLCDPSMKFGLFIFALPVVLSLWVGWLLLTPWLNWPVRHVGLLLVFVLGWGYFGLLRFDGAYGDMESQRAWRWEPTAEDRYLQGLAKGGAEEATNGAIEAITLQPGDWSGFRGPGRDGIVRGLRIKTDWDKSPPKELWRHKVGPNWSSFAVVGSRLYSQEQRGENEAVVCYSVDTGKPIWVHEDKARFTEAVAGPGPRATPTFHEGRIFALGAAGRLNCLDAATGTVQWSRDIVEDSGSKAPTWGFSASPLVVSGIVTVIAADKDNPGKAVLGYHASSGEPAWTVGQGSHSYASTHYAKIAGIEQVLSVTDAGLESLDPVTGKTLWMHALEIKPQGMARVTQPALVGESDILLGTGFGNGTTRLRVSQKDGSKWSIEELWTSRRINPYYNDMVVHEGNLYGFDGIFFTCVELEKGASKWRVRGYGSGQVILLAEQGLLLVLSEKGEAVLLKATPDGHEVLGRLQALEGKTWNHPVIAAGGKLFVRNGEEMACFALEKE